MKLLHGICALIVLAMPVQLMAGQVDGLRLQNLPDKTRLVLDVSEPLGYRLFSLENPPRVVIDVPQASLAGSVSLAVQGGAVRRARSGSRPGGTLRLVLDLAAMPATVEHFTMEPGGGRGDRIVVDLLSGVAPASASDAPRSVQSQEPPPMPEPSPAPVPAEIVVVIDAGHGGKDPGAIGRRRTREKDVTLAVARHLAERVNAEPGMRAVLTRRSDVYLQLRDRVRVARRHNASLFVSLHADSFKDRRASGSSVYALSNRGASSEAARWLAQQENAADLVGGVSLESLDREVAEVVLDMSQDYTIEASMELGTHVLRHLGSVGRVHKPRVERAGFAVLKAPDIPSVLVELAFLSNPSEELKLRSVSHQKRLAGAVFQGVRDYFGERPPQPRSPLPRLHVVQAGETLGGIARRYSVTLDALRNLNGIPGEHLVAGSRLKIPGSVY
jgi:N-acetylmuramoyl-L-alanine amidase